MRSFYPQDKAGDAAGCIPGEISYDYQSQHVRCCWRWQCTHRQKASKLHRYALTHAEHFPALHFQPSKGFKLLQAPFQTVAHPMAQKPSREPFASENPWLFGLSNICLSAGQMQIRNKEDSQLVAEVICVRKLLGATWFLRLLPRGHR